MATKKTNNLIFKACVYTLLVALSVIFLFPMFLMLSQSLFSQIEILRVPRPFVPSKPIFNNFAEAFTIAGKYVNAFGEETTPYMLIYLRNSLFVTVMFVLGMLVGSSLCAYAFSKIRFVGREKIFMVVLTTMMIPSTVTMLPMCTIYKFTGLINTLQALWVPIWFGGGAVNIFLLRQFMRTIPDDIFESAEIDGAGHARKYLFIMLPNCVPIMAFVALGGAIAVWNDFFTPLLYINTQAKWTLALGIANIIQTNDPRLINQTHLLMAACVTMSLLPLLLFIFGQKLFIENVTFSGLKL